MMSGCSQPKERKMLSDIEEQRKARRAKELLVLRMRRSGKSNRDIGEALGLSTKRVSQIYCKAVVVHRESELA
jgi:DNA-binding NarL/FixJ family response regulator